MAALRVAFCVSGEGRLFQRAVCHSEAIGIQPVLLVADERAADFEDFCAGRGIAYARVDGRDRDRFDAELVAACERADPDLLVLTFDRLVPGALLERFPSRVLNVHLSLLPAFPGFGAVRQALEAGVKVTGATMHLVDGGVDTGRAVGQCVVAVAPGDTRESLGRRIYAALMPMYLQVLQWFAQDRVWSDEVGRVWIRDADYSADAFAPHLEVGILELARRSTG